MGSEETSGINYAMLPPHMREAARRYVEKHKRPGDFLMAVLCDRLTEAFARADDDNLAAMNAWCRWLWNELPSPAWGSPEKVAAWCAEPPESA